MIDTSPYRRKLPRLIGAFAFLAFSFLALLNGSLISGMEFGPQLIIYMLETAIPFALCLALIGYLVGRTLDQKSNRRKKRKKAGDVDSYKIDSIFSDVVDTSLEEADV